MERGMCWFNLLTLTMRTPHQTDRISRAVDRAALLLIFFFAE
jgi:hypothetical protein